MTSNTSVGHIVRQVFFAIILILFAVMQSVYPIHDQLDIIIDEVKTANRLTFAGGIMVTVMTALLVLFGFVARSTDSALVMFIGVALMGVSFVGNIVWVAGLGKLIDYTFDSPYVSLDSRVKASMVGNLLGVFFFNTSFLLLCLKDYVNGQSGGNGASSVSEYNKFSDDASHLTFDHIIRKLVHLLGMILYYSMAVAALAGYVLDEVKNNDDITTAARLMLAGSVITLVSSTVLAVVSFVASPSTNAGVKGVGFLFMFLVFAGSILMVAGNGKYMDLGWDNLTQEQKVSSVGDCFGFFGFANVFILYCLPDFGYLM
eukprot:TRINITY_DN50_c1_g1_i4.p1 TRINITY_DN50_c1_g1~~TRINITY_DN50_c1_g1_i4.p1  ORF type:complete len:316 (+),score=60.07 TRINITY_DN50_c1_g1_i4:91-1038(+)